MEDPHAKQVSPVSIISDVRRDGDVLELAKPVGWSLQPKENHRYRLRA